MVDRRHFLELLAVSALALPAPAPATVQAVPRRRLEAGPENYRRLLRRLQPGDHLHLRPGAYRRGLPLHRLRGTPEAPIVVSGPSAGGEAVLAARPGANTVSLLDCAHVTVRDLRLEGGGLPVDGVKAEGHARHAHHVTLEGLTITGHGATQQTVGISTKCPAWGWVVRGCRIEGAGTGMYFGDSDGSAPFFDGFIEENTVLDTRGYNLQVKHQLARPDLSAMPRGPQRTVIRRNVFGKERGGSAEMPRPNVLVGHWPLSGPGSEDLYLIHGNLFYGNPTERLFQGEGNLAVYDNVLVNLAGDGLAVQPHNDVPRKIWIVHNTIVARDTALWITTTPELERLEVTGNAIFAADPLAGEPPLELESGHNLVAGRDAARRFLRGPLQPRKRLDARPASAMPAVGAGVPRARIPGGGAPAGEGGRRYGATGRRAPAGARF